MIKPTLAFVRWLFGARTESLFHPDSPGEWVTVTRTRFGRLVKPAHFATLKEAIESQSSKQPIK